MPGIKPHYFVFIRSHTQDCLEAQGPLLVTLSQQYKPWPSGSENNQADPRGVPQLHLVLLGGWGWSEELDLAGLEEPCRARNLSHGLAHFQAHTLLF